jgi:hypothetical protein
MRCFSATALQSGNLFPGHNALPDPIGRPLIAMARRSTPTTQKRIGATSAVRTPTERVLHRPLKFVPARAGLLRRCGRSRSRSGSKSCRAGEYRCGPETAWVSVDREPQSGQETVTVSDRIATIKWAGTKSLVRRKRTHAAQQKWTYSTRGHCGMASAKSLRAAAAKACMLANRSALPVSSVMTRSMEPATARQVWPLARRSDCQ